MLDEVSRRIQLHWPLMWYSSKSCVDSTIFLPMKIVHQPGHRMSFLLLIPVHIIIYCYFVKPFGSVFDGIKMYISKLLLFTSPFLNVAGGFKWMAGGEIHYTMKLWHTSSTKDKHGHCCLRWYRWERERDGKRGGGLFSSSPTIFKPYAVYSLVQSSDGMFYLLDL